MGIVEVVENIGKVNPSLYRVLRKAHSINLNYTLRLKNYSDQWIIQLEIDGVPFCHVNESANLSPKDALRELKYEASTLRNQLTTRPFVGKKITGSYFACDRKKKRDFGELE